MGEEKGQEFWKAKWLVARKMTQETKLQVLQYKILHRILPTNLSLSRQKIRNSPECENCPGVSDTIEHAYRECPIVSEMWKKLEEEVTRRENQDQTFALDLNATLLGLSTKNEYFRKWNCIALILKHYIYISKLKKVRPCWPAAFAFIKQRIKVYDYLCNKNKLDNNYWAAWR